MVHTLGYLPVVQVLAERFSWTIAEVVVVVVGVRAFPLKELAFAIGIDLLGSSVITSSLVVMASRGEIDPAFKMPLVTCALLSMTSSDLIHKPKSFLVTYFHFCCVFP